MRSCASGWPAREWPTRWSTASMRNACAAPCSRSLRPACFRPDWYIANKKKAVPRGPGRGSATSAATLPASTACSRACGRNADAPRPRDVRLSVLVGLLGRLLGLLGGRRLLAAGLLGAAAGVAGLGVAAGGRGAGRGAAAGCAAGTGCAGGAGGLGEREGHGEGGDERCEELLHGSCFLVGWEKVERDLRHNARRSKADDRRKTTARSARPYAALLRMLRHAATARGSSPICGIGCTPAMRWRASTGERPPAHTATCGASSPRNCSRPRSTCAGFMLALKLRPTTSARKALLAATICCSGTRTPSDV